MLAFCEYLGTKVRYLISNTRWNCLGGVIHIKNSVDINFYFENPVEFSWYDLFRIAWICIDLPYLSRIRIRIDNTDPDPDEECKSPSSSVMARIQGKKISGSRIRIRIKKLKYL